MPFFWVDDWAEKGFFYSVNVKLRGAPFLIRSNAMLWLRLLIPRRFPYMDCLFPSFTPMVPADLTALLNDAVARYQERDRVCTYRQSNRSRRVWTPDCGCYLGIARYPRRGDL